MTSAKARSSLRSPGAAIRARVPNEARADAPKPTPATTVPAAASARACASTPAKVNAVPVESVIALISKTRSVGQVRNAKAVRAPAPHSSVTTRPPMKWLCRPKRPAATEGPSERIVVASWALGGLYLSPRPRAPARGTTRQAPSWPQRSGRFQTHPDEDGRECQLLASARPPRPGGVPTSQAYEQ